VARSDVVIGYDTYPHVDMRERGREAAALIGQMLAGRRLRTLLAKVPVLASPLGLGTDDEPMRGLLRRAQERSEAAGLVRISITGGFSYSDVERAGISVLVVCDDETVDVAREVLAATAVDIAANEDAFQRDRPGPSVAVAQAIASPAKPVVIADVGDNVGGGGAGDGTAILGELLAQGARSAVVLLHDPEAVELAESVGVGGTFGGEVGGKTDDLHGDPVLVRGRVAFVGDSAYTAEGTWTTGGAFTMGRAAVIEAGGTLVVVTELRVPPFHREQLTVVGVDPAAMDVIVAKGAVAWRAAFGDDACAVIEADTPGVCPVDPYVLPRSTTPVGL
jgi:microcystin degradation protein MlrC